MALRFIFWKQAKPSEIVLPRKHAIQLLRIYMQIIVLKFKDFLIPFTYLYTI